MPSLYLHIPFCEHKCVYCDFYSIAPDGNRGGYERLILDFLRALSREIDLRGTSPFTATSYDTVFFGGGTPSLLTPTQLSDILSSIRRTFTIDDHAEVTIETNPGTVDREKLEAFQQAGVNRLSIGIQSFHQDDLNFLTRIHSADQAAQCVRDAQAAGFSNVSLDLIFALPGQTLDRWMFNLRAAVDLDPSHISCYSLIVEPDTPLSRMVLTGSVKPLAIEDDARLYESTIEFLGQHGYAQYEVSNFAKPGMESRHNSAYWNHTEYLGFGPSAHSFWGGERWWNIAQVQGYIDRLTRGELPLAGLERLSEEQWREEAILLGLRSGGIDLVTYRERFGRELPSENPSLIEQLIADGLVTLSRQRLSLTSRGYVICDEICQRLL